MRCYSTLMVTCIDLILVLKSSVLISNTVNINVYNLHRQKLFEVLNKI